MSLVFGTTLTPRCAPHAEIAAFLAARMHIPLSLVHVSEDSRAPVVLGTHEEHILGPVRATLAEEAARLRTLSGADVRIRLASGSVVDALTAVAERELASAVLLGSSEPTGTSWLGTTSERASRDARSPVITLRRPERLRAWLEGHRPLRVLVGADLGRAASAARAFAVSLGALGPCALEVAYVGSPASVHERFGLTAPHDEDALSREAEAALWRDLARAAPATERAVLRVIATSAPAEERLVAHAAEGDFDLVVVGQRRNSLIEQLWYGSVARGVLRSSAVSVACVPRAALPVARSAARVRTVLCATDLDEVGALAFAHAASTVAGGGTVHVAHVLTSVATTTALAREARERAAHALSKLASPDEDVGVERHVIEGDPANALLALAERVGAELLVAGARSAPAVPRAPMAMGAVPRALVQSANVPVLLVPVAAT